jgi:hypothetical protein
MQTTASPSASSPPRSSLLSSTNTSSSPSEIRRSPLSAYLPDVISTHQSHTPPIYIINHQMASTAKAPPQTPDKLLSDLHVSYVQKLGEVPIQHPPPIRTCAYFTYLLTATPPQNKDDLAYHLTAHLRLNAVYWGFTALCILGRPDALGREEMIEFVMSCWDDEAGIYPPANLIFFFRFRFRFRSRSRWGVAVLSSATIGVSAPRFEYLKC